jgi:hypothetical protein
MPTIRFSKSALGISIVSDIEKFINDNANASENDKSSTHEDGAKALANAIAYGISRALSDISVQTAFYTGIVPPTVGGNPGMLIHNALSIITKE